VLVSRHQVSRGYVIILPDGRAVEVVDGDTPHARVEELDADEVAALGMAAPEPSDAYSQHRRRLEDLGVEPGEGTRR
jgi:endonuclease YncB( thermonuclease family)